MKAAAFLDDDDTPSAESFLSAEDFLGPDDQPPAQDFGPPAPVGPQLPQRRRGVLYGNATPYGAPLAHGRETITADPLARPYEGPTDWQAHAAQLSQRGPTPEAQAAAFSRGRAPELTQRAPAGVAQRMAEALGGGRATGTAADLLVSYGNVMPTTVKLAGDLVQLASLGTLGEAVSDYGTELLRRGEREKSDRAQAQAAELQALIRDGRAGVLDVAQWLVRNPEFAVGAAVESTGSLGVAGAGGLAARGVAQTLARRRTAIADEIAQVGQRAAERGVGATNVAMGAAGAFADTQGDTLDKLTAAGLTAAGYKAAGRLTGGGAESALAGARRGVLGTAGREFWQEAGETGAEYIGGAVGEGKPIELGQMAKEATVAGAAGGVLGAGVGALGGRAPAPASATTAADLARERGFLTPARPITLDEMPTTPLTQEQAQAIANERGVGVLPAPVAQPEAEIAVQPGAIGVAATTQGTLAQRAQAALAGPSEPSPAPAAQAPAPGAAPAPPPPVEAPTPAPTPAEPPAPPPRQSVEPFPSLVAAQAFVKMEGLGDRVLTTDTGHGIVLAPAIKPRTPDQERRRVHAVDTLDRAVRAAGMHRGPAAQIQPVPDAEIAGTPGGIVARVAEAAFGFQVVGVRGLGDYGVSHRGYAFFDVDQVNAEPTSATALALGTIGHEVFHALEAAEPATAAAFATALDAYLKPEAVERQLVFEQGAAAPGQAPVTREYAAGEVRANVNGAIWLDPEFWKRLYDLDDGSTFRRVMYQFMRAATRFIRVARGTHLDIEQYVTNVDAVRNIAAQAWAERAGKIGAGRKAGGLAYARTQREGARELPGSRAGISFEVAPKPKTPQAARFGAMEPAEQAETTRAVGPKFAQEALRDLGLGDWKIGQTTGRFEGVTSPTLVAVAPPGTPAEVLGEAARVLGYVFDQKAVIAFDETNAASDTQAGFVKVVLPAHFTPQQIEALREGISARVPQATGDTLRGGALVYGNFSEHDPAVPTITDDAFAGAIEAAIHALPDDLDGTIVVDPKRFHSDYIEPGSRDGYLRGTRYGESDAQAAATGRDDLRRTGRGDLARLAHIAGQADAARERWIAAAEGRRLAAGAEREVRGVLGRPGEGRARPSYGTPRPGSVTAVGYHFSQAPRAALEGGFYGTGLRGAERRRLEGADPRLRQRIYFYVDTGKGITPEAGVGGVAHQVELRNLYDADANPLRLRGGDDGNAFEQAAIDAGFDGILVRSMGMAVLLGRHIVPVESLGRQTRFAGEVVPLAPAPAAPKFKRKEAEPAAKEDLDKDELQAELNAELSELGANRRRQPDIDTGDAFDWTPTEVVGDDAYSTAAYDIEPEPDALERERQEQQRREEEARMKERRALAAAYGEKAQALTDEALARHGVYAEAAYPVPEYRGGARAGEQTAWVRQPNGFLGDMRVWPVVRGNTTLWASRPLQFGDTPGYNLGFFEGEEHAAKSREAGMLDNQLTAASAYLHARKFDLVTTVDAKARTRIAKTWRAISELPNAHRLQQLKALGETAVVPAMQKIADRLLARTKTRVHVARDSDPLKPNWFDLKVGDANGRGEAQIEIAGKKGTPRGQYIVFHTTELGKGSGRGVAVYQIGHEFAHHFGLGVSADPRGLSAVNTIRRTEQLMSAALRHEMAGTATPGLGQRIYGWNAATKDAKARGLNFVRLALANMRNVGEIVPEFKAGDIDYDLEHDRFTRKGQDIEPLVGEILARPVVRDFSLSRSALARAALTGAIVRGRDPSTGVTRVKEPVLYSRRGSVEREAAPGRETQAPERETQTQLAQAIGDLAGVLRELRPAAAATPAPAPAPTPAPRGKRQRAQFFTNPDEYRAPVPRALDYRRMQPTDARKNVLIDEIGALFDRLAREEGGPFDFNNPEHRARAVEQGVAEMRYQLGQERSGLDWYDKDVTDAYATTARVLPMLERENQRQLFSVVAGIMSVNTRARRNWIIAAEAFEFYKATGTMPGRNPVNGRLWDGGHQAANKDKQLRMIDRMVKDVGEKDAIKWLFGGHTIKELNWARWRWGGMKPGVDGKKDDVLPGVWVFGPKVGPFVMALNGVGTEAPMDVWATRTFNRWFGTMTYNGKMLGAPTAPQRRAFEGILDEIGAATGHTRSQVQGVLWFYEQQLYDHLGARDARSEFFSEGAADFTGRRHGARDAGDGASGQGVRRSDAAAPGSGRDEGTASEELKFSRRGAFPPRHVLPAFTTLDRTVEKLQDRYNRWKQAVETIQEQNGQVSEANDFYRAEERYHGKVGARLEDFQREVERFVKAIDADKLTLHDVQMYAYARHAPERNAYIKSIRPDMDAGSGMSDQDAAALIADAQNAGLAPALDRHAATLRRWTDETRDLLLAEGLITTDEYQSWRSMFNDYVPLKGGRPDLPEAPRRTGQGFNIRGKESERAKGRYSEADDIIEHIVQDRTRAVIRAGKNEVLRSFLQFVLDNPSPNLWEVNAVERRPVTTRDDMGNVVIEEANRIIGDERTIGVKDGGQQVNILVHDDALRDQLKNLNEVPVHPIAAAMLWVQRLMGRMYTSLNPVFTVLNAARDVQAGFVNMIGEGGFTAAGRMALNLPGALREAFRAETLRRPSLPYQVYRTTGGKTGFLDFKTIDQLADDLSRTAERAGRSWFDPRELGRKTLDLIERLNGSIENATRYAAFKATRDAGGTVAKAAEVAKNITVNFNRRGAWGPYLSSIFLFWNPAVQGTARLAQALADPKVLATLGGGMVGLFFLALRNADMGDDDDGVAWWDKIPSEVKERNIVIVLPPGSTKGEGVPGSKEGRYVKIPMPYGYNFFAVVAQQAADVMRNSRDPKRGRTLIEGVAKGAIAFMGSWLPVDEFARGAENTKSFALAPVPDWAKPFAQPFANLNAFGRPMYPEDPRADRRPDSAVYFPGQAGTLFQRTAETLNRWTGGSPYREGWIDVHPAQLENVVRAFGGGPASFTLDLLNAAYVRHSIERPDLDVRRLPYLKQLYGVIDAETDRQLGYARMERIEKAVVPFEAALKDRALEEARRLRDDDPLVTLGDFVTGTRRTLSELRKQELSIISGERSEADKYLRLRALDEHKRRVLQQVNRAFDQAIQKGAARKAESKSATATATATASGQ